MATESQSSFEGWAKVEVMGHQSHIGFVKTETYGGAVLFRVDTPPMPEREHTLARPDFASGEYCPIGTVVKRKGRDPVSVLVGAGSIYRIIPCTEAAALEAIDREQRAELMLVRLPEGKAIAAPSGDSLFDPDSDEDRCEDCGKPEEFCRCL